MTTNLGTEMVAAKRNSSRWTPIAVAIAIVALLIATPAASAAATRAATAEETAAAQAAAGGLFAGAVDQVVFQGPARVLGDTLAVPMIGYLGSAERYRGTEVFYLLDFVDEPLSARAFSAFEADATCGDTRSAGIDDVDADLLDLVAGGCANGRPAYPVKRRLDRLALLRVRGNRAVRRMSARLRRCDPSRIRSCAKRLEKRVYLPSWRKLDRELGATRRRLSWSLCSSSIAKYRSAIHQHRRAVHRLVITYGTTSESAIEDAAAHMQSVSELAKSRWEDIGASCYPA